MEISFDNHNYQVNHERHLLKGKKKKDKNEKIVRKTLVKIWTDLLIQYAQPGVQLPPIHEIRRVLIREGVEASIDAVIDAHWFVFDWMIRDEIECNVREGIDGCDLEGFIQDVKAAQNNPALLEKLRGDIKHYVMAGF